jgi:hypothetical protein
MTNAILGAAIVDDLFGIRPVAPTSHFPITTWKTVIRNGRRSSLVTGKHPLPIKLSGTTLGVPFNNWEIPT